MSIPTPAIFRPVTIEAGVNDAIVFTADTIISGFFSYTGTLAAATYNTHAAFVSAVETSIRAAECAGLTAFSADLGAGVLTVVAASGRLTIAVSAGLANATSLIFKWQTSAATQALGTLLGFGVAETQHAVTANAVTATAAAILPNLWTPGIPVRTDSREIRTKTRTMTRTAGGQNQTITWETGSGGAGLITREVRLEWLPTRKVYIADEVVAGESFETFWESTAISRFEYLPDLANPTVGNAEYFLLEDESASTFRPERLSESVELYAIDLKMGRFIA